MATPRNTSKAKKPHAMSSEQVSESNTHHERRFAQIDRDIFSVKTDVGVLQADVKTLASGQVALQESQDRGFRDVKDTLVAKSQEQPKVSVAMLISILGVMVTVVVVGVGAFWSVVVLLADPIRNEVREHKLSTLNNNKEIALLDERARQMQSNLEIRLQQVEDHELTRYEQQAARMSELAATLKEFQTHAVENARLEGRLTALEEVRRLNDQRVCDRIGNLEKLHQTPGATP